MGVEPRVNAWVKVYDGCDLRGEYNGDGHIEVQVGGMFDGFDLIFEPDALRRFLEFGQRRLDLPVPTGDEIIRPRLHSLTP